MSYHSSRARRAFEGQLDQELHEITPLYRAIRKSGADDGARLLAAYYVLAFAQLEVYIKNFVEDTLNAVSLSDPSLDKWPDLMVAYLLHKGENLGSEYRKFSAKSRRLGAWRSHAGHVGCVGFPRQEEISIPEELAPTL